MNIGDQWVDVLRGFDLPPAARVLVLAPGREQAVLQALAEASSAVEALVLRLPGTPPDPAVDAPGATPVNLLPARVSDLPEWPPEQRFDAAALDHALDDLAHGIIAAHEGIAVRPAEPPDEYAPLPRAVRAYRRTGDFERIVKPEMLRFLAWVRQALRPRGRVALSHYVTGDELRQGQPLDLYSEYVPIVRRWMRGSDSGLREMKVERLDRQWWLCLERVD